MNPLRNVKTKAGNKEPAIAIVNTVTDGFSNISNSVSIRYVCFIISYKFIFNCLIHSAFNINFYYINILCWRWRLFSFFGNNVPVISAPSHAIYVQCNECEGAT